MTSHQLHPKEQTDFNENIIKTEQLSFTKFHWRLSSVTLTSCRSMEFTREKHYSDAITSVIASQITGVSNVYSALCSVADLRKFQSFESLTFVRGIHRWPMNSPHKGPVTPKMFAFDDVIMLNLVITHILQHHTWGREWGMFYETVFWFTCNLYFVPCCSWGYRAILDCIITRLDRYDTIHASMQQFALISTLCVRWGDPCGIAKAII